MKVFGGGILFLYMSTLRENYSLQKFLCAGQEKRRQKKMTSPASRANEEPSDLTQAEGRKREH